MLPRETEMVFVWRQTNLVTDLTGNAIWAVVMTDTVLYKN